MCRKFPRPEGGFTYLGLLITVMLMTSAVAAVAGIWEVGNRREKEIELLFIGNQFRNALAGYYRDGTSEADRYPREIADLVKDPRVPGTRRYLRKLYTDPITGTTEWGLIRNTAGGIIGGITGIYSKSEKTPLKQANFSTVDQEFAEKEKYSDWIFVNRPRGGPGSAAAGPAANAATTPAATSQTGPNPGAGRPLPSPR